MRQRTTNETQKILAFFQKWVQSCLRHHLVCLKRQLAARLCIIYINSTSKEMGPDSSVGIAIRYGTDGPGIESWLWRDSPHPSRPTLGHTQPPIRWVPGLLPEGKATGACWPPTTTSTEVKERVELYLCSPSEAFIACSRANFTFTLLTPKKKLSENPYRTVTISNELLLKCNIFSFKFSSPSRMRDARFKTEPKPSTRWTKNQTSNNLLIR